MEEFKDFKISGVRITQTEKEFLISKGCSYCCKCTSVKLLTEFGSDRSNSYGFSPVCKECKKKDSADRRLNNPEHVKKIRRESRNRHAEYSRAKKREWFNANKEKVNTYKRDRYATDPLYKLQHVCRQLVRKMHEAIRMEKFTNTSKILGYTPKDLKEHLEKQFKPGMSWDNYGEWHIDHIIPISSATTLYEGIKLSQLDNLQPLWAEENLAKGCKIE